MRCIAPAFDADLKYAGRCRDDAIQNARLCWRHAFIERDGPRPMLIGWIWRAVARWSQ